MEIFKVEIKETLSRIIEINAKSIDEAISQAKNQYNKEEIVLDYDDYIETEIIQHRQ